MMGLTFKNFEVKKSREAEESASLEFMIDSGAVYSLVQSDILDKLGIKPYKTVDFTLADGTKINRNVGDAYFGYLGEGGAAPVMFGQDGDRPLLGVTALEVSDWYIILLKESCIP
ncbi:MAG: aspartyl protease [Chitinophagales bacterium]|nr:aspartyl protease [Chitinophagales bacterium]